MAASWPANSRSADSKPEKTYASVAAWQLAGLSGNAPRCVACMANCLYHSCAWSLAAYRSASFLEDSGRYRRPVAAPRKYHAEGTRLSRSGTTWSGVWFAVRNATRATWVPERIRATAPDACGELIVVPAIAP